MRKAPSITEAEWHVMKVFWEKPGEWLSAGEIVEPVARERRIHHRTVRTLLSRLVRKGAAEARAEEGGGGHRYRAKVERERVVREESRTFLSRVFDGKAAPALVHLLQEAQEKLSAAEIAELRALLERKGKA